MTTASQKEPMAPNATNATQALVLVSENFDVGPFPPENWKVESSNINGTWQVDTTYARGDSGRGAAVRPHQDSQGELLYSPPIQLTDEDIEFVFWAMVTNKPDFANPPNPNKDVRLWIAKGGSCCQGDDIPIEADLVNHIPQSGFFWTEFRYDFPSYLLGQTVQIVWDYDVLEGDAGAFAIDDVLVRRKEPDFVLPHSHVAAPYKVGAGQTMTYVLVISNTGQKPATSALVRNELPPGLSHVAGTAKIALVGGGVVSTTFTDTAGYVEWAGSIPTATGVFITIPVQVNAGASGLISNVVTINDPHMATTTTLVAETQIYSAATLLYSESFNDGPGDGWQGNGKWEWGKPIAPLDHPHSWSFAWGTNLSGHYDDIAQYVLTSTVINLTNVPPTRTVFVQFWEWFEGDGGLDAGDLKVNGDTIYTIRYDRTIWTERWLDISDYAGQEITLTFEFTAAGTGTSGAGWYIDDVGVHLFPPSAEFEGSWKRVDRAKVTPGGRLTYTFYITNSGSAASTQGYMRDELPPGFSVNQALSTGSGSVTTDTNLVEWRTSQVDALPVGADTTITVVVDVSPTLACGTSLVNAAAIAETGGRLETSLQTPPVSVYPGDVHFASLFDTDDGGWTAQGGVWAWGETFAYGNGPATKDQPAHSYPYVWGTVLGGDVPDIIAGVYTLTFSIDLGDSGQLPLAFQWWEWYQPDDADHTGTVLVSSTLRPTPSVVYQAQEEQQAAWRHRSVELDDYIGHDEVHFNFVYAIDGDGKSGPGWYIDSVALHDNCPRLLLQPPSQIGVACRGFTATFQVNVFNWDIEPAQINLDLDGYHLSSISPPSLTVSAATTGTVTVYMPVPTGGNTYVVIVNASNDNGASGSAAITTTATTTAHWQVMTPLAVPRAFHATVALDDALYVIGGSSDAAGGQPVSTTFRYDPATDAWTEETAMPFALSHVDAAVINGEIYLPGGLMADGVYIGTALVPSGVYTNTTLVYNPVSKTWRRLPAPTSEISPVIGYEAVAYNGQLVRLGGYLSPTLVTSRAWTFDPGAGTWATIMAMQGPRAGFAVGVQEGKIYVAGGFDGTNPAMTTEVYDGSAWTQTTAIPSLGDYDRWLRPADAVLQDQLYLIGGERSISISTLDHTGRFDPIKKVWQTTPDLPRLIQPRSDLEADVAEGAIYAVGGRDASGTQIYATNEKLVFCPVCHPLISVQVIDSPAFVPLAGEQTPVSGQTLTFTTSYEPPTATQPITFSWNWNDGTPPGSGQQTTHVYTGVLTDPVEFTVRVLAGNCGGTESDVLDEKVEVRSYPVYSASLSVAEPTDVISPGAKINRFVYVKNVGTRTDSYTITKSTSQWPVTIVIPFDIGGARIIGNVKPGDRGRVWSEVAIPADIERGDSDSFTLTVTPFSDPERFQQAVVTTLYPFNVYIYLPLVIKQQ